MGLPATRVRAVNFQPDQITVTVRLTRQKLECPDCKYSTRASYDLSLIHI